MNRSWERLRCALQVDRKRGRHQESDTPECKKRGADAKWTPVRSISTQSKNEGPCAHAQREERGRHHIAEWTNGVLACWPLDWIDVGANEVHRHDDRSEIRRSDDGNRGETRQQVSSL